MQWIGRVSHREQVFFERIVPRDRVLRGALIACLVGFVIASFSILSFARAARSPQDLLAAGRVDQAIEILEEQLRTSPTAEAYNLLCRAYFELDAWDNGIPPCEKAVSLEPNNGLYHMWMGRIYGEKAGRVNFMRAAGLARKVHGEFERAVEFGPNSWETRTDLAEFYVEAPGIFGGGEDKARAEAAAIAPLNPAMAHWVKARLAEKKKDGDAAEQEYRLAIEASHSGARAWTNLAGFFRRSGRFPEMEQALRTMESAPLDNPSALVDGADILLRSGREYPMAVRFVRRYIALPNPVEESPVFKARCTLGELLEKQGDRAGAAEQYRAALALAHSFRPAQDGLKRVTHE